MKNNIKRIPLNMMLWCLAVFVIGIIVVTEVKGSDICDHKNYIIEELEIDTYRTEKDSNGNYTKVPTSTRGDEWIFAGWYTDTTCKTALGTGDDYTGIYTAKFVPKHVLGVKAQVSGNLYNEDVNDDTKASLRFVTSVDSLKYSKVGFEVVLKENAEPIVIASNYVYKKLYAIGNEDEVMGYEPENLFCALSTRFKACVIKNIPATAYENKIAVTPFWITKDGTIVKSNQVSKSVKDGISENQKVSITIEKSAHGTVVKAKETYLVGETVELSGVGDEGYYCYGMTIDGEPVDLNMDGTFRFVARQDCTVKGEFDERIFKDNANWNTLKQNQGVVYLPNGGDTDAAEEELEFYKQYENLQLTLTVKNVPEVGTTSEDVRTDVKFVFEDGKFITFGVVGRNDNDAIVQSMSVDSILGDRKTWGKLTSDEKAQYESEEGIDFRIVRIGTEFSLYIGDRMVGRADFEEASGAASVYLRHWADEGVNLDIPFTIVDQFSALSTKDTYSSDMFYVNTKKTDQDTADPFVFDDTARTGYYYLYGTNTLTNPYCYRSKDMMNWEGVGNVLDLTSLTDVSISNIWAPEVIYDSKTELYYFFFSATPDEVPGEKLLMVATSTSPYKNFKVQMFDRNYGTINNYLFNEKIAKYLLLSPDKYNNLCYTQCNKEWKTYYSAIDPHPYVDESGNKYLFWVDLNSSPDVIYGIQMTDWLTPNWDTVKPIVAANYWTISDWKEESTNLVPYEDSSIACNEGPTLVQHNDKFYMTFSINSYKDNSYQVVQAVSDTVLGDYKKLTEAEGGILLSGQVTDTKEITGTGHHSFMTMGEQTYIVYHRHTDAGTQGTARYPAIDEVKWVQNSAGLDVMYVNGPTNTIQPAIEYYSKYSNLADNVSVKGAENTSYLNDGYLSVYKVGNPKFKQEIGETTISKTTAFTFDFDYAKEIGAIMIYNSKKEANCFENVAQIELICEEDGETVIHYVKDLEFSSEYYETEDGIISYVTPGAAAWAEFSDKTVKSVRIIVEVPEGETIGISEIRILGKEYKATTSGENGTVYFDANRMHIVPNEGYQAVVTIDNKEVHYTQEESIYVLPSMSAEEQREAIEVTFSEIDANHDVSKYVATIGTAYYTTLEEAVSAAVNNDTVVLLKDVTVETAMEANKQITITNKSDVTITRGTDLVASAQTLNVPERGNVTILGAEGTTFTIDGGSTEATSSRFAWVGGTLNLENVTVANFKSTATGAVVYNAGTVNFTSSIVKDNSSTTFGGAILNGKTGILNITDSDFTNNTSSSNGGVVASGAGNENGWDGGTINIDGGSFTGNKGAEGGVICAWSSIITINGNPTFSGNQATSGSGGVIRTVDTNTTLTMNGGTFDGNSANSFGDAIAMHYGTIQNISFTTDGISANEIHLFTDNVVLSSDVKNVAVTETEIKIGPSSYATNVAIVSKKNADVTDDAFAAVIAKITVEPDANGGEWFIDEEGYLVQAEAGLASTGKKYASLSEAFDARNTTEDTITVYKDATWDRIIEGNGKLTITNTADVTLTRSSDLIESNTLMISYGGTLTIEGKEGTTLIIDGASTEATGSRMAWVGGTLTFENVEIKNFKSTETGGIVYNAGTVNFISANVNNNSSTGVGAIVRNANAGVLNSTNSTFSNNTSSSNGGVFASGEWSGGTINIDGGSFTGNKAAEGGVICGWDSTVTINGNPTFSNNQATSGHGGAIRAVGTTTITINGGTFNGNSATSDGGTIFNTNSLVINKGVSFTENTSSGHGAVIFNEGSATTTINGGTFSGNTTTNHGGVIAAGWADSGTITINGGTFSGNKGNHGGVIATWGASVTIKGTPTFEKNIANGNGGAICRAAGSPVITIEGGTFSENSAPNGSGGAIYSTYKLTFKGATFKGNTAKTSGGAIYAMGTINAGACTFENNKVGTVGNDITITPSTYAEGTQVVTKAADTVTDAEFATITKLIQVTPDSNGGRWLVDENGCLTIATVTLSSNNKDYFTLDEAIADMAAEDTITVHKDTTWDTAIHMSSEERLTITNTANVTITRGSSLFSSGQMLNVAENSEATIEGAEGTTLIIEGASTEKVSSRFAWVGGTLTLDNVTVQNFKSTVVGAVIRNGNSATINSNNSTFRNNESSSNGGVIASGEWNGGTINITGGSFTGNKGAEGGVICSWSSNIVIDGNPTFSNNQATTGSGGVIRTVDNTVVTINGGTFSNNQAVYNADSAGGVVCLKNAGVLYVNGGTFSNNTSYRGGAFGLYDTACVTIKDGVKITGNQGYTTGGAIVLYSSTTQLTLESGVEFDGNKTTAKDWGGGGAIFTSGQLIDQGAVYKNNESSGYAGGAVRVQGGSASFNGTQFMNNVSGDDGGAIFTGVAITVNGCTFKENTAKRGGAIYHNGDSSTITICIFESNDAINNGAGDDLMVKNAILTDNTYDTSNQYSIVTSW